MTLPEIIISQNKSTTLCQLSGSWLTSELTSILKPFETFQSQATSQAPGTVTFDLSKVEIMDTAGALILLQHQSAIERLGEKTSIENAPDHVSQIIATVDNHRIKDCPPAKKVRGFEELIADTGKNFLQTCSKFGELINFLGLVLTASARQIVNPGRIRLTPLISQMEQIGIHALPIVGLISFLIGVVLAFQGSGQLERFGAQIFTINLVAVGVLREMGILLTAIIVAGRSGSAFTAQIGTMKVNEEIDAMRTIGLDPVDVLVLPRIFGLVLVLPLLTFYADIMGLIGGAAMTMITLDLSLFQYIRYLQDAATLGDFFVGMFKAPIFAFIIALIGCHEGFQVSRSAESVGRQTTRSVVEAIFFVIVLDALLSILFSVLGI